MDARQKLYRQSKSDNPDIAFPALVKLGLAQEILPTTDTGYKTYGTGRLFLPAGTNYLINPSFETDTDANGTPDNIVPFSSTAGVMTVSRVAGRLGGYAMRIQESHANAGGSVDIFGRTDDGHTAAYFGTANSSFAENDVATLSCYIKGTIANFANIRIYLKALKNDGTVTGTSSLVAITLTTDWQRVSVSYTCPALTTHVHAHLQANTAAANHAVDVVVDDVLIEKSPVLTPYFDGTYPNCAWTGTANASTSTRTVSVLKYPLEAFAVGGTAAMRYTPLYAGNGTATERVLYLNAGANDRVRIFGTGGRVKNQIYDGTDFVEPTIAAVSWAAGTTHVFVARWIWASTADISQDGTAATQGDASAVGAQTIDSVNLLHASAPAESYAGPLLISPSRKSDGWTTAIQASSGAAFSSPMRLWRDFMSAGDVIFPLQGDSKGYKKLVGVGSVA